MKVNINLLEPNPFNRKLVKDEEYFGLKESIKKAGGNDTQVITRDHPTKKKKHEIIDGDRRANVIKELKILKVDIDNKGKISDLEVKFIMLESQISNKNFNPIFVAETIKDILADGKANGNHVTQEEVGKRLGKKHAYISAKLSLLEDNEIKEAVNTGLIAESWANNLMHIENEKERYEVLKYVIKNKDKISRGEVEKIVSNINERENILNGKSQRDKNTHPLKDKDGNIVWIHPPLAGKDDLVDPRTGEIPAVGVKRKTIKRIEYWRQQKKIIGAIVCLKKK